jgi:hypothetical protein
LPQLKSNIAVRLITTALFMRGCVESLNMKWTGEARKYLLNEVSRRAVREKLLVSIDNDMPTDKFREAHGLTTDQVIWLVMKFEDSTAYKGGVDFTLNANSARLYLQGAIFDPGISFAKARPTLDQDARRVFRLGRRQIGLGLGFKNLAMLCRSVNLDIHSRRVLVADIEDAQKKAYSFSAGHRIIRGAVKRPLVRECVQRCRLRRDRYIHIGNNFCTRLSRKMSFALLLQSVLPEVRF